MNDFWLFVARFAMGVFLVYLIILICLPNDEKDKGKNQ